MTRLKPGEEIDLKDDDESYREAFEKWYSELTDEKLTEINNFRAKRERFAKAIEAARTLREEAEAPDENDSNISNEEDEEEALVS